jgi:hypothetical protein
LGTISEQTRTAKESQICDSLELVVHVMLIDNGNLHALVTSSFPEIRHWPGRARDRCGFPSSNTDLLNHELCRPESGFHRVSGCSQLPGVPLSYICPVLYVPGLAAVPILVVFGMQSSAKAVEPGQRANTFGVTIAVPKIRIRCRIADLRDLRCRIISEFRSETAGQVSSLGWLALFTPSE